MSSRSAKGWKTTITEARCVPTIRYHSPPRGLLRIWSVAGRSNTHKPWLRIRAPTKLYDRTKERLTLDEIDPIRL
jgi:hypothetical protein